MTDNAAPSAAANPRPRLHDTRRGSTWAEGSAAPVNAAAAAWRGRAERGEPAPGRAGEGESCHGTKAGEATAGRAGLAAPAVRGTAGAGPSPARPLLPARFRNTRRTGRHCRLRVAYGRRQATSDSTAVKHARPSNTHGRLDRSPAGSTKHAAPGGMTHPYQARLFIHWARETGICIARGGGRCGVPHAVHLQRTELYK